MIPNWKPWLFYTSNWNRTELHKKPFRTPLENNILTLLYFMVLYWIFICANCGPAFCHDIDWLMSASSWVYLPSVVSDGAGRCLCRDRSCDTAAAADDGSGRVDKGGGGGVHSRTTAAVRGNSACVLSTLIASSKHSSSPDDYSIHHITFTHIVTVHQLI